MFVKALCSKFFRTILEIFPTHDGAMGNNIKKEPLDGGNIEGGSDSDDGNDLMNDDQPRLSVKERLDKLKLRGITIDRPGVDSKKRSVEKLTEDFDDDFVEPLDDAPDSNSGPLPHLMVTVTMRDGEETKIVPLDKIRELRNAENR
jgi:hypothetical protein